MKDGHYSPFNRNEKNYKRTVVCQQIGNLDEMDHS